MNLGVVVYAPDSCTCLGKYLDSVKRLSAFFPAGNNTYIKSLVKTVADELSTMNARSLIELQLEKIEDLSSITRKLIPGKDGALFFTEVRRGLDVDLQVALESLFERMVERYLSDDDRSRSDKEVWTSVYRSYFQKYDLEKKLKKEKIKTSLEDFVFQRTWKNGHLNLLESVNFDLKSEQSVKEKVHKWLGKVSLLQHASEDLHLYLLSQLPKDKKLRDYIRKALAEAGASNVEVKLVDESKAEDTARALATEIAKHEERMN